MIQMMGDVTTRVHKTSDSADGGGKVITTPKGGNNGGEDPEIEGGGTRYLGFFNQQQGLRIWCQDGHKDEERLRMNGWNPVWSTTSKDAILKWVSAANTPTFDKHQTPSDHTISDIQNTTPRAKSQFVSNLQQAWDNSKARLQMTAHQLGMETSTKDSARMTLEFEEEATIDLRSDAKEPTDDVTEDVSQGEGPQKKGNSAYKAAVYDTTTFDSTNGAQPNHRFSAFRSDTGSHLRTSTKPEETFASANSADSTILHGNHAGVPSGFMETPNRSRITNPYSTGRTPLEDKDLWSSNDAYLLGVNSTESIDEVESLYLSLNLPQNLLGNVRYAFVCRRDADESELYLDDKQIKNLPRLRDLRPESLLSIGMTRWKTN
jgi:hypothetical protein